MEHAARYFSVLGLLVACSCADSILAPRAPKLIVTVESEGHHYDSFSDDELSIQLGTVPVFAAKAAFFKLSNPSVLPLKVSEISYSQVVGHRWDKPGVLPPPAEQRFRKTEILDFEIPPSGEAVLRIQYAPLEEGDHRVVATIASNAANVDAVEVTVTGSAIFTGGPEIEVEYTGYRTPQAAADYCTDSDNDGTVEGCFIAAAAGLSLGNIGLGTDGTGQIVIRNVAQCPPFAGVDTCSLCGLLVDNDSTRQNIGIGFKAGSNSAGHFAFVGSTVTPIPVPQRNVGPTCDESGEIRLLLNFHAPDVEGDHSAVVVIESNDPDEPLIEIPISATARNGPVAIANFRAPDPANPTGPSTDPNDIEPLDTVYFDGRASYDPADPSNPLAIASWQWEVVRHPIGASPADFQLNGDAGSLFNFWLPLAGTYEVKLTVWNNDGVPSGDTPDSRVEFEVIPGSAVHVQLTWDNTVNDQDLHLLNLNETTVMCDQPWDCYFSNKKPVWYSASAESSGPNPTLDIDDTHGLGPENINIRLPKAGTYRVMVHYWHDFGVEPTRNTVRIYLHGFQVAEFRRTITEFDQWSVADIVWNADGTANVVPIPGDIDGEIGTVTSFPTSDCSQF